MPEINNNMYIERKYSPTEVFIVWLLDKKHIPYKISNYNPMIIVLPADFNLEDIISEIELKIFDKKVQKFSLSKWVLKYVDKTYIVKNNKEKVILKTTWSMWLIVKDIKNYLIWLFKK